MKVAFDVDVLTKQMGISDMVYQVADWGYKYIEQSPHPRINPFYKHPLFSRECENEYRAALQRTGLEISSFIVVYRWSGPTEEQRRHAVANWKRMIEIADSMDVRVINTELSGDPHQPEICNGMLFRSLDELLPLFEKYGIRCELQSHPFDFCELNNETVDIVKSYRTDYLKYVYSCPHGFFYDQGKGDVRAMLEYAGDDMSHILFADTFNQTLDCRYIVNPPGADKGCCTVHQHLPIGQGDVDFDGIFETLRKTDFAHRTYNVGGESIACVSMFGFPEKMAVEAPRAREIIEKELLLTR
ncbi:sugar phosphate isomerase/epimerase [Pasteurellaceae bacterium LIM206]|nr:sugar phosphate isomerase/epimerase [Pasteurellaceae bacterium LIM206]